MNRRYRRKRFPSTRRLLRDDFRVSLVQGFAERAGTMHDAFAQAGAHPVLISTEHNHAARRSTRSDDGDSARLCASGGAVHRASIAHRSFAPRRPQIRAQATSHAAHGSTIATDISIVDEVGSLGSGNGSDSGSLSDRRESTISSKAILVDTPVPARRLSPITYAAIRRASGHDARRVRGGRCSSCAHQHRAQPCRASIDKKR